MHVLEVSLPPQTTRPGFVKFGNVLAAATEICAAILVLVEIGVLIAGTFARYFFGHPLTWTDELASMLFLWLAMFGSVIALRRGASLRLTTFVNKMPRQTRAWIEVFGMVLTAAFLLFVMWPAFEHFDESLIV